MKIEGESRAFVYGILFGFIVWGIIIFGFTIIFTQQSERDLQQLQQSTSRALARAETAEKQLAEEIDSHNRTRGELEESRREAKNSREQSAKVREQLGNIVTELAKDIERINRSETIVDRLKTTDRAFKNVIDGLSNAVTDLPDDNSGELRGSDN